MTYKILNTKVVNEHVVTEVEYNFNGEIIVIEVFHFMPKSQSEIEQNIVNRAYTEKERLDSINFNENLITQITIGEEKPIN